MQTTIGKLHPRLTKILLLLKCPLVLKIIFLEDFLQNFTSYLMKIDHITTPDTDFDLASTGAYYTY